MCQIIKAISLLICIAGATPAATCTVVAAGVSFGTYSSLSSSPLDSTGAVVVTCVTVLPAFLSFSVELGPGNAGGFAPRKLASGSNWLNYNLYVDGSRSSIWGNGLAGTSVQTHGETLSIGPNVVSYMVYGRVFTGQNVQAGAYSDAVLVSVNY